MKNRILLILAWLSLGFNLTFAQVPTSQKRDEIIISTMESDGIALIKAESLKKAWKSSYKHVISVNPDANLKAYIRLEKLLTENPKVYNPKNTLIISSEVNNAFVKEAATGYNVLDLMSVGSKKSMIVEGTMRPLTKEDNEPGYDFIFTKIKDL